MQSRNNLAKECWETSEKYAGWRPKKICSDSEVSRRISNLVFYYINNAQGK